MKVFVCAVVGAVIGGSFTAARADNASPETAPTVALAATTGVPTAPSAAPVVPPVLPANFDPCGGPQELLNKFGLTPCVVVGGEAMLSAGYVSAKVNGNVQAGTVATLPASALVRIYPQALATVGLSPCTDVQFTPATYARVDIAHFPLLVSGDTDFQVGFKQRVAFDPVHGTITSVAASVEFPTGSPALRAPGPAYKGELLGSYAFPRHLGLIYDMQLSNAATNNSQGRNTTLSLTVLPYYQSPGNLLAGAAAVILPSGTVVPEVFVEQLVNRHVGVEFFYAGMGTGFVSSTETNLPTISAINVQGSVNVIGASLFAMIGRSGP
jgi:hypothetical protein